MKKSSCAAVVSGKICKKPFWSRVPSRKHCSKHTQKVVLASKSKEFLAKNYGTEKIVVSSVKEKKGKKK